MPGRAASRVVVSNLPGALASWVAGCTDLGVPWEESCRPPLPALLTRRACSVNSGRTVQEAVRGMIRWDLVVSAIREDWRWASTLDGDRVEHR